MSIHAHFWGLPPNTVHIPVGWHVPLDTETPISALLKGQDRAPLFLLESVEQATHIGRFSFLGMGARFQARIYPRYLELLSPYSYARLPLQQGENPLLLLRQATQALQVQAPLGPPGREVPPFYGGWVGYWAYDMVRFFERLPQRAREDLSLPWAWLVIPEILLVFDHVRRDALVFILVEQRQQEDPEHARDQAQPHLTALLKRLQKPLPPTPPLAAVAETPWRFHLTQQAFERMVHRAKAYIAAGDIFQVVLSQRLSRTTPVHPLAIYRALRHLNPSPYMFYLDMGGRPPLRLIGASPEMLVRLRDGLAETRPIAGTRPRGRTPEDDAALEAELRSDPKERAEHVMLVDLGRNDLGRVCEYGTVQVPDFMVVERYSHVMHLVSRVVGQLRPEYDAWDLLQAAFPAGTVSGAPKIRAMEIIEELEPVRRGPYAGAVGYIGFQGNMDTCITIRTIVMQGQTVYLQAGAGIVDDSIPRREWEETLHKARALGQAVEMASQFYPRLTTPLSPNQLEKSIPQPKREVFDDSSDR